MNFKEKKIKKNYEKQIEKLEQKIINILNESNYYHVNIDIKKGIINCRFDGDLNNPNYDNANKSIIFETMSLDTLKRYLTDEEVKLIENVKKITYDFYGNNIGVKVKGKEDVKNDIFISGNGNVRMVGVFKPVKSLKIDSDNIEFFHTYLNALENVSIHAKTIKTFHSYIRSGKDFILVAADTLLGNTKIYSDTSNIVIESKNSLAIKGTKGIEDRFISKSLFLTSDNIDISFLKQLSTSILMLTADNINLDNSDLSSKTINIKANKIDSADNIIYGEEKTIIRDLSGDDIYKVISPSIIYNGIDVSNMDNYMKLKEGEKLKNALLQLKAQCTNNQKEEISKIKSLSVNKLLRKNK